MDLLTALKNEIVLDPKGLGYASFLPDRPGYIADALNKPGSGGTVAKTRLITERGLMSAAGLGPVNGALFLDKLDLVAASGLPGTAPLKRIMKYLYSGDGIDIGDAATAASLQGLLGAANILQHEIDAVLGMAHQGQSRAEELGLGTVTIEQIMTCGATA